MKQQFTVGDKVRAAGADAVATVVGEIGGWIHISYENGARGVYEPERLEKVTSDQSPVISAPATSPTKKK